MSNVKEISKQDQKTLKKREFFVKAILRSKDQLSDQNAINNWSVIELEERLKQVQINHDQFTMQCMQLESSSNLNASKLEEIAQENREVEDACFETKIKMRIQLQDRQNAATQATLEKKENDAKNKQEKVIDTSEKNDKSDSEKISEKTLSPKKGVIPKTCIEFTHKFSGSPNHWYTFKQLFEQAIHVNTSISDTEKLSILRKACPDETQQVVLAICGQDYEKSWKKTCDLYGNSYRQAQWCLRKIISIPPMHQASGKEIQRVIFQVSECENILKIMNHLDTFDATIALVIIDKFDPETARIWNRHHYALAKSWALEVDQYDSQRSSAQYLPTFTAVKDFLKSEMEVQEMAKSEIMQENATASYSECVKKTNQTQASPITQAKPKPEAFVSSVQALQEAKRNVPSFLKCTLCDGIHPIYKCEMFKGMSLEQRNTHAELEELCRKCLRTNHQGPCVQTKSNESCPSCAPMTLYHNSMLCPKNTRNKSANAIPKHDWNDEWSN